MVTGTPPSAWPGTVLRRPSAGYADLPTTRQPAIVRPDPADTAGRHHADDHAARDPRGWWWRTPPTPARPPVDLDGPTHQITPAAVVATAREEHHW